MSLMNPRTLEEWRAYVRQYEGITLLSKVRAANSLQFFKSFREDGVEIDDVKNILLIFVQRLCELGYEPPRGGIYDLKEMAELDPLCVRLKNMPKKDLPAKPGAPLEDSYNDPRTEMDDLEMELKMLDADLEDVEVEDDEDLV